MVSREEVLRIAQLARLHVDAAAADAIAADLATILDHMSVLNAAGDVPLSIQDAAAPVRADEPGADPLGFPVENLGTHWQNGFFTVPRLAALDAERVAE